MSELESLSNIIQTLLDRKTEGTFWDFKEEWHKNNIKLLHDIISLANNPTDKNGYLIFGIVDKTYDIVGVSNDNRKKQADLNNWLGTIEFVGGIRPVCYVDTIVFGENNIDIITVVNDNNTPYTLAKDYAEQGFKINAGSIYTRINDKNTDKGRTADINIAEHLWKKRFGLNTSIRSRFSYLIKNPEEWETFPDNPRKWFNSYNPEFTIELLERDSRCFIKQPDASFYYLASLFLSNDITPSKVICKYHSTIISESLGVNFFEAISNSASTFIWGNKKSFVNDIQKSTEYFFENDLNHLLNLFLLEKGILESSPFSTFNEYILLFKDKEELNNFATHIEKNFKKFSEYCKDVSTDCYIKQNNPYPEHIQENLMIAKSLKEWLTNYRYM